MAIACYDNETLHFKDNYTILGNHMICLQVLPYFYETSELLLQREALKMLNG